MMTNCDFLALAIPGVQGLRPYQPGKPIEELEREYGIKNAIKLASNENPIGPSSLAIAAMQSAFKDLARYPDGNGFILKQALAQHHQVDMSMITLGNGSNELLELVARTFVTPVHSVIFSEYAFAVYPLVTQALNAEAIVTPAQQWGHDLVAMQTQIKENTRLIFIANPNNPTGTWVDKTNLKRFLEQVPEQVIVVLDEAYCEYVDEPEYPKSISWLSEHRNLVITRTFSKGYGLAGLRVGYSISHPDIADLLNRIREPFNVNTMALVAATAALQDKEHLAKVVALNHAGMQQITQALKSLGISYIPSIGNFLSIDVGQGSEIYQKLLYQGVITRPVDAYRMPRHLRVSIGSEAENHKFISALQKVL